MKTTYALWFTLSDDADEPWNYRLWEGVTADSLSEAETIARAQIRLRFNEPAVLRGVYARREAQ